MRPVYSALVHHPILDRSGQEVTTAVTNLDVHDLARSTRSYDLSGFFVVSPITAQRAIVDRIVEHWLRGEGKQRVPERGEALRLVRSVTSIEAARDTITDLEGAHPTTWTTSARRDPEANVLTWDEARALLGREGPPILLLFGTGHGLAPEVVRSAEALLPPIRPDASYNHLSVRAAAAICLDRLVGDSPPGSIERH